MARQWSETSKWVCDGVEVRYLPKERLGWRGFVLGALGGVKVSGRGGSGKCCERWCGGGDIVPDCLDGEQGFGPEEWWWAGVVRVCCVSLVVRGVEERRTLEGRGGVIRVAL